EEWLYSHQQAAKELMRAWFEAVDWWKENPEEGNEIIAKGLDWPLADVKEVQYGAVMLTLDQNLGAYGLADGKPFCASIPPDAPQPASQPSGWGKELFGQEEDCVAGYVYDTWNMFNDVYFEAGVALEKANAPEGLDPSILKLLANEGYTDRYTSNRWIGRLGL
ncbi:MAG: hypothetical protein O7A65_07550, partial [Proteobacteria bacterium]|nr:hypothetical protein [Pseudomonadota bacterium]